MGDADGGDENGEDGGRASVKALSPFHGELARRMIATSTSSCRPGALVALAAAVATTGTTSREAPNATSREARLPSRSVRFCGWG